MRTGLVVPALTALSLVLAACPSASRPAPVPGTPDGTPDGPATGGTGIPSIAMIRAAGVLPRFVSGFEEQLSGLAVEAVLIASQQRGTRTTTGTLTETPPSGAFSYVASPADRMVVVFAGGIRLEYVVNAAALEGNVEGGANAFLGNPHRLEYSVVLTGPTSGTVSAIDWRVESQQGADRVTQTRIAGTATFEGSSRTVNLMRARRLLSEVGPGSNRYEHEENLTGTVTAGALTLGVNQQNRFKLVNTVVNSTRTFDNSWTDGTRQFRFAGLVRLSLTDGRPSEPDFWRAEGALTRDGQTIGTIGGKFSGDPFEVFVDGPNGRVVLETHGSL